MPGLTLLLAVLAVCRAANLQSGGGVGRTQRQAARRGADISTSCLRCICQARHCDWSQGCRDGACGGYQITAPYFRHSNITRDVPLYADRTHESCTSDPKCAITVVRLYMQTLATDCDEDGEIDCLDMMMTHFYGLEGCIGAQSWIKFTETYQLFKKCMSDAATDH